MIRMFIYLLYAYFQVRTFGYAIVIIWISIVSFIVTKSFPILFEIIDIHGVMMIFGVGSILGGFFVAFVMEETSGKSLDFDDVGLDKKTESQQSSTSGSC